MIHRDQILDTTINPLYYKGSFKKINEKNILINRKKYCDWIDDLSKKNYKNIFWWFLNPVSRNLYYENLFHYFCLLEAIDLFFKDNKNVKIVIINSDIFEHVSEILKNNIVKIKVKKFGAKLPLYKIVKFFFINFLYLIIIKIFFSNKKLTKCTLIDIYVFGSNIDKDNSYKIISKMRDCFYVPTFVELKFYQVLRILFKIRKDNRFLLKEELLNFFDIFKAANIFIYAYFLNINVAKLGKWNLTNLVKKEIKNFSRFESIIFSYLNYLFAFRLKKNGCNVVKTINWFENQNIDKGWNLGFSKYFPESRILGYQGFTYSPHFLNNSPTNFEIESNVIPKIIYSRSSFFVDVIKEFSTKTNLKVIKNFKKKQSSYFRKIKNNNKYSFVFSGVYSYDIILFNEMLKFSYNNKQFFYAKFHPALPYKFLYTKNKENFLPKNILIYDKNLQELLAKTEIVIASGPTTSLIESLLNGCKLILLNPSIYDKLLLNKYNIPKNTYLFMDNLNNLNFNSKLKLKKLLEKDKKKLKKIFPYEVNQLKIQSII